MNLNQVQMIESIAKLKVLDFQIMLPGHGKPLLKDASGELAKLMNSKDIN